MAGGVDGSRDPGARDDEKGRHPTCGRRPFSWAAAL
ncbi:MAG: hypothetical protein JWM27_542 [Gemmatimonadetes bacterium]|nr:hypothetical protein [Gemmatimonadota bacterium]